MTKPNITNESLAIPFQTPIGSAGIVLHGDLTRAMRASDAVGHVQRLRTLGGRAVELEQSEFINRHGLAGRTGEEVALVFDRTSCPPVWVISAVPREFVYARKAVFRG